MKRKGYEVTYQCDHTAQRTGKDGYELCYFKKENALIYIRIDRHNKISSFRYYILHDKKDIVDCDMLDLLQELKMISSLQ